MLRSLGRFRAAAASAAALGVAGYSASSSTNCISKPDGLTKQRTADYTLAAHYHGKRSVRVLRVRRQESGLETVQEYNVQTRLFSPEYSKTFTHEDNSGLVATDTQKNTVYVVAQRTDATTPEAYGADLCRHLLFEYPLLSAVEVDVTESLWQRATTAAGEPHDHGFVRVSPECALATVRLTRAAPDSPEVTSGLSGLTVLKTTQSGFEGYLHDKYTLLPDTRERCMATEMEVHWSYVPSAPKGKGKGSGGEAAPDYARVRETVRNEMLRGFYGPPSGGVYSPSLQATIYDAGCLVLKAAPRVASISIFTPNIHMIPMKQLSALGGPGQPGFQDDVYIATSEPSGTISCTVDRS